LNYNPEEIPGSIGFFPQRLLLLIINLNTVVVVVGVVEKRIRALFVFSNKNYSWGKYGDEWFIKGSFIHIYPVVKIYPPVFHLFG